jgi:hypothetical protein
VLADSIPFRNHAATTVRPLLLGFWIPAVFPRRIGSQPYGTCGFRHALACGRRRSFLGRGRHVAGAPGGAGLVAAREVLQAKARALRRGGHRRGR